MNKAKLAIDNNKAFIQKLCAEFGMENPRIFGSVLNSNVISNDIDILVRPLEGTSYFDLVELADALENLLGYRVDLVSENGLSPYLKDEILTSAVSL